MDPDGCRQSQRPIVNLKPAPVALVFVFLPVSSFIP